MQKSMSLKYEPSSERLNFFSVPSGCEADVPRLAGFSAGGLDCLICVASTVLYGGLDWLTWP